MVKMTDGVRTFEVPTGAVSIYESVGFSKVYDEPAEAETVKVEPEQNDEQTDAENHETEAKADSEVESFIDSVMKKPLASWSKMELKKFTDIKGIDVSGAKNVGEVRDIIKSVIE